MRPYSSTLRFSFLLAGRDSHLQGDGWEIGAGSLISGVRSVKAGKSYHHCALQLLRLTVGTTPFAPIVWQPHGTIGTPVFTVAMPHGTIGTPVFTVAMRLFIRTTHILNQNAYMPITSCTPHTTLTLHINGVAPLISFDGVSRLQAAAAQWHVPPADRPWQ